MKIAITGRKCSPRDSFKERAEKKLAKVEKFFGDDAEAKITATVEKSIQIVEITVIYKGMIFRSQEKAENMNDALDRCVDSLVRQIRKNKTKLEKRIRGTAAIDTLIEDATPIDEEMEFDVVRTKTLALKPQTVDEAILQMNMLGHRFYMFLNEATGLVNVVYGRTDGGYGLLEPDVE